jgi:hypothetical protein
VNPEHRLAEIVSGLEALGVSCLVMGGHAVRYYGLNRNTNDFDLHLDPDRWEDLAARLASAQLFAGAQLNEGPSWRPNLFRRFQIGRLPDGREEWLEFWRGNHLLPPFSVLSARAERGTYGGRLMSFLSLPDLIRSKETERAADWRDVAVLEEFLDSRRLARAATGEVTVAEALCGIRSRSGFEAALQQGFFAEVGDVEHALCAASLATTQAFLLPFVPAATNPPVTTPAIEPVILSRLRTVSPASPLHLTLVEAVRRQYRLAAQAADKADKERESAGPGERTGIGPPHP